MNDLINGREMLKRYQEDLCYGIACKECSMCTEDGGCRVEEWIDNFPSADRPQGEWIDKGWKGDWQFETDGRGNCWYEYECSECGFHNHGTKSKYCPNCGCRMKGADDD